MIEKEKINEVIDKIVNNYHPEKIILFGSYATGCQDEKSDLDLLIIKDTDKPSFERDIEVLKLFRGLKIPLDILVYTNDEFNKWKNLKTSFESNVLKTGKILYAAD